MRHGGRIGRGRKKGLVEAEKGLVEAGKKELVEAVRKDW